MGLCKCRNVTNQFCFQHKKNVCETCIITDHQLCIVKSYLSWLQDSETDPNCTLCKKPFTNDSIRLVCLDLFHTDCIKRHLNSLDKTTTSKGFCCPICKIPVMPMQSQTSSIANNVRQVFMNEWWAKSRPEKEIVIPPPVNNYSSGIAPTMQKKQSSSIRIDPDDASYKQQQPREEQRLVY
ncbi:hypothetical protein EDD86DRAFT_7029 [Gorgonomyces haynaldii]|nr:hypothetical protein EDD86DRAFT_7029 [Gorgonomyces haynaldii]